MLKKKVNLILFTTLLDVFARVATNSFDRTYELWPGVSILFDLLIAKQIQMPWH